MLARALLVATLTASLLAAGQASAHAKLVASDPAANASVTAPKAISLTFNEKLAPAFSSFEIAMANGMKVPVKTVLSKDRLTISGAPQGKLAPGAYRVTWHAASAEDGHRMDGVVAFTVK
ncbi:MAG TPA: copper homeostasis periplasmic binding protein CopC [Caulobacter sp.]|nr:copper homeostasis periplasmic binding protein CopC [Caulobacter sp.]